MRKRITVRGATPASLDLLYKALAMNSPARDADRRWAQQVFDHELGTLRKQLADDFERYATGGFVRGRTQAEWWMKRHIRDAYTRSFVWGKIKAGGFERIALSSEEKRWLRKLRLDEYTYLRRFLDDIDSGKAGRMSRDRRVRMYADALRGPFWAGWALANRNPRRRITWKVNWSSEHCATCAELDGRTWSAPAFAKWVRKTGILPGQNTKCLSNCACWLEEAFN